MKEIVIEAITEIRRHMLLYGEAYMSSEQFAQIYLSQYTNLEILELYAAGIITKEQVESL